MRNKLLFSFRNKQTQLWLISILFALLYVSISLVNHYNFRTYALDLGAYTNALYDYLHFQWNDSTVFKEVPENLLSDHFDLYLIIFAPLSLLFGTYTLLVVQIVAVLIGGWGVYRYFSVDKKGRSLALMAAAYFYLFFGNFSAISYDYHSNVVAASIVPWFFVFVKQKKIGLATLMVFLIVVAKENISLWMAFIALALSLEYRRDKFLRNYLMLVFILCLAYFAWITSFVMPYFSNNNAYPHFHYSFLGNNSLEAFLFLIKHPLESVKVLFINHVNHPMGDYIKAELHILLLISGLPFLLRKPQYFLMLIPIYFQKLFHDNIGMWGIDGQYSVEFAPIMVIGVFSVIATFSDIRLKKWLGLLMVALSLGCTLRIMDNTVYYTNKNKIRFYKVSHYQRDINVPLVHQKLKLIPDDAIVSAESKLVPHLALRDKIYQFPLVNDAEFIVYTSIENTYPLDEEQFYQQINVYRNAPDWVVMFENEDLTILRKKTQFK
jgi:uncharacterized membrane protein